MPPQTRNKTVTQANREATRKRVRDEDLTQLAKSNPREYKKLRLAGDALAGQPVLDINELARQSVIPLHDQWLVARMQSIFTSEKVVMPDSRPTRKGDLPMGYKRRRHIPLSAAPGAHVQHILLPSNLRPGSWVTALLSRLPGLQSIAAPADVLNRIFTVDDDVAHWEGGVRPAFFQPGLQIAITPATGRNPESIVATELWTHVTHLVSLVETNPFSKADAASDFFRNLTHVAMPLSDEDSRPFYNRLQSDAGANLQMFVALVKPDTYNMVVPSKDGGPSNFLTEALRSIGIDHAISDRRLFCAQYRLYTQGSGSKNFVSDWTAHIASRRIWDAALPQTAAVVENSLRTLTFEQPARLDNFLTRYLSSVLRTTPLSQHLGSKLPAELVERVYLAPGLNTYDPALQQDIPAYNLGDEQLMEDVERMRSVVGSQMRGQTATDSRLLDFFEDLTSVQQLAVGSSMFLKLATETHGNDQTIISRWSDLHITILDNISGPIAASLDGMYLANITHMFLAGKPAPSDEFWESLPNLCQLVITLQHAKRLNTGFLSRNLKDFLVLLPAGATTSPSHTHSAFRSAAVNTSGPLHFAWEAFTPPDTVA